MSIRAIDTRQRELFYWAAILVTFALGTAAGDWISEEMNIGYMNATLLFGALIATTILLHYQFKINTVLAFWIIYVLTRPLGASIGDWLSQPEKHGGLGFGVTHTSLAFFACIIILVIYQPSSSSPARHK